MNINLEIELLLDDINEYTKSILLYLSNSNSNSNSNLDLDEIIMYLSSVDEIITTIKNLLLERNK